MDATLVFFGGTGMHSSANAVESRAVQPAASSSMSACETYMHQQ